MTLALRKQQIVFTDTYYFYLKASAHLTKLNTEYSKELLLFVIKRLNSFLNKDPLYLAALFLDLRFKISLSFAQQVKATEVLTLLHSRLKKFKSLNEKVDDFPVYSMESFNETDIVENTFFNNSKPSVLNKYKNGNIETT